MNKTTKYLIVYGALATSLLTVTVCLSLFYLAKSDIGRVALEEKAGIKEALIFESVLFDRDSILIIEFRYHRYDINSYDQIYRWHCIPWRDINSVIAYD